MKHLAFTCLAYAYLGFGLAVENFGVKAGLSVAVSIFIFISSVVIFMIMVFTSMEKVKRILLEKEGKKINNPSDPEPGK